MELSYPEGVLFSILFGPFLNDIHAKSMPIYNHLKMKWKEDDQSRRPQRFGRLLLADIAFLTRLGRGNYHHRAGTNPPSALPISMLNNAAILPGPKG